VAANRTAHSIAVFRTDFAANPPTVTRTALLPAAMVGADSEPWAVAMGNDNDTAYVILRRSQQVLKITGVRTAPTIATARASVGSEPTGLAISPTGRTLYVSNYQDGTVSVVNTADMTVTRRVDLNAALASSGLLGPSVMAAPRPALAHPRAIVVTNNGDTNDDDETVYVSEFFAQARTSGVPAGDQQFDVNKQGVVYRFNAGTGAVGALITLAPVADTGFQDSTNAATGCFPNQLFSLALNNNRLYVSSVCESPRGPTGPVVAGMTTDTRNFQTQIHAVLNVVDTATNAELPAQKVLLNQRLQAQYTTRMVPDDGSRRMPLIVNDMQFVQGTNVAYLSAYGADAMFRVRFAADGSVSEVGTAAQNFINLASLAGANAGRLPVGLALASSGANVANRALAINENTRNVTVVNLAEQSAATAAASDAAPTGTAAEANNGRRFFVTGLGRWSLKGQAWNSCESCHPDGLSDNVTWFFARGPRQTSSLDATFNRGGTEQRILNWTGIFDEVHDFELNTRGNSGGLGAIVHRVSTPPGADDRIIFDGATPAGAQLATATPQAGMNGSAKLIRTGVPGAVAGTTVTNVLADWDEVDAYVKTIRAPRRPTNLDSAAVTAGRALFEANNCGGCHGGPLWTTARRFWTPSAATNGAMGTLRSMTYTGFGMGRQALNPPSAMGAAPLRFTNADPMVVGANDQINCVLRSVGTIGAPAMMGGLPTAVAAPGVTVLEARQNFTAGMGMVTPAQGVTGFSPPGLVGMGLGAPYFHAGNARTLEEAFTVVFQAHYQAFSANFLTNAGAAREADVRNIVAFVLSIDDDTMTVPVQGGLSFNPQLCPNSL
jgi:YVTN family beta-propeller protein